MYFFGVVKTLEAPNGLLIDLIAGHATKMGHHWIIDWMFHKFTDVPTMGCSCNFVSINGKQFIIAPTKTIHLHTSQF